jgi:SET domain-containing protein
LTDANQKIQYLAPDKIVVDYSDIEGIGVFATTNIKAGDIIERCPMVSMGWRSNYQHDPTVWKYLYFQPQCDCNDCKNHGRIAWMVLGYGMLYNHQDAPNTKWSFNYNKGYADVIALRDISRYQEIFVSYGSNYFKNKQKINQQDILPDQQTKNTVENMMEDIEDDDIFMEKINKLLNSPASLPTNESEDEEDDAAFLSRINKMMQNEGAKPKEPKTPEQIAEEIRLYGGPL